MLLNKIMFCLFILFLSSVSGDGEAGLGLFVYHGVCGTVRLIKRPGAQGFEHLELPEVGVFKVSPARRQNTGSEM